MLRPGPTVLSAILLCLVAPPAARATRGPTVVYDGEYGGYVPIVAGIERPDLVARPESGRAPTSARLAVRRARRGLRAERRDAQAPAPPRQPTKRWVRRQAITTTLWVLDSNGNPLPGARVFRYHDPSFYAVNDDESGARLFGAYRYLPFSFPAATALEEIALHDEDWGDAGYAPVTAPSPDIDEHANPFLRDPRDPQPPVEYVGTTGPGGALTTSAGVFNLRDVSRFPRAVVPDRIRIGYVVVAEGYVPGFSEKPFTSGGVREERTVMLLLAPDNALVGSTAYAAALARADALDATDAAATADVLRHLDQIAASLDDVLPLVAPDNRDAARAAALARIAGRVYRRAGATHRLALATRAADAAPSAARLHRVARELVAAADRGETTLAEAEEVCRRALRASSRFAPAYRLLDDLLVRRAAGAPERTALARRLVSAHPFDRWARARLAALTLQAGRDIEAFDHLRYTWSAAPGLGGDRELARRLADHYWRLGLPEKSGAYLWMLSGRVPEDPRRRLPEAVP
ncbi:MAG: hypothetical protein KBD01_09655 [Acidobacteria bacterium]|nr:hypothetical protein [Acidobacteriota bacterium]